MTNLVRMPVTSPGFCEDETRAKGLLPFMRAEQMPNRV